MNWWLTCDEFLAPHEASLVLERALEGPQAYEPSEVMDGHREAHDSQYRRSNVRYYEPTSMLLLQTRLMAYVGSICERLRIRPFAVSKLEVQLSCSGHGDYYRLHSDNHNVRLRSREITCVYYVNAEPKAFSGGELRIYAPPAAGGASHSDRYIDVEPRHNRLVAFPSSLAHEVRPVVIGSNRFTERRFALNAWLHA